MDDEVVLPATASVGNRFSAILDRAQGKRVMHIGCTDAGLLEERAAAGTLLHARLAEVAATLGGIDVDAEAVAALGALGYQDLFVADVCQPGSLVCIPDDTDLLIVSEVLEHLSNPGGFLDELRAVASRTNARALFTVPSPFNLDVLLRLLRNIEFVHPDHNFWFSYRTVQTLLSKHGWAADEVRPYSFEDLRVVGVLSDAVRTQTGLRRARSLASASRSLVRSLPRRELARWLVRRSAYWSDGVLVMASASSE